MNEPDASEVDFDAVREFALTLGHLNRSKACREFSRWRQGRREFYGQWAIISRVFDAAWREARGLPARKDGAA